VQVLKSLQLNFFLHYIRLFGANIWILLQ